MNNGAGRRQHIQLYDGGSSAASVHPKRRIRHISRIEIRNLTPSPLRDAMTSTLNQQSAPLNASQVADDIELTLSRRRMRRASTTSVATLGSHRSDSAHGHDQPASKRPSSGSKRMSGSNSVRRRNSLPHNNTLEGSPGPSTAEPPGAFPSSSMVDGGTHYDGTQKALEDVLDKRLVETFLVMSTLPSEPTLSNIESRPTSPSRTNTLKGKSSTQNRTLSTSSIGSSAPKRTSISRPLAPKSPTKSKPSDPHKGSLVVAVSRNRVGLLEAQNADLNGLPTPAPSPPLLEEDNQVKPFFISGFHRPSTNPTFPGLDPEHDFAPWVDLGLENMRISLWGKVDRKSWGKLPPPLPHSERLDSTPGIQWCSLFEWCFNLNDLLPVSGPIHLLPPNTLVIYLAPDQKPYCLPSGSMDLDPGRPPSPSGHSDGELDSRNMQLTKLPTKAEVIARSRSETKMKKTAPYGTLLKLVSYQAEAMETEQQLDDAIVRCDTLLESDQLRVLQREISFREENIKILGIELTTVSDRKLQVLSEISSRRAALRNRREVLHAAFTLHEDDRSNLSGMEDKVKVELKKHEELLSSMQPVRTTLFQTLTSIFPIEPKEPKDLLFTIVSVPLPIPLSSSEPAPPLTLTSDPSFNEETVASALGYVAQVVHLAAAYVGVALTYPVTCVGSRSLIKDPISAMMGPRMFPLYSKGIDTYRFEYGVFLLNKNIEMLMNERNLRAIDIRQTLPNLHNLLLTLSSGVGAELKFNRKQKRHRKHAPSSIPSISLTSESASVISNPSIPSTPQDVDIQPTIPLDVSPIPTPTPSTFTDTARKTFYSPLAALLRARYPSVRTTPPAPDKLGGAATLPKSSLSKETLLSPEAEHPPDLNSDNLATPSDTDDSSVETDDAEGVDDGTATIKSLSMDRRSSSDRKTNSQDSPSKASNISKEIVKQNVAVSSAKVLS